MSQQDSTIFQVFQDQYERCVQSTVLAFQKQISI